MTRSSIISRVFFFLLYKLIELSLFNVSISVYNINYSTKELKKILDRLLDV